MPTQNLRNEKQRKEPRIIRKEERIEKDKVGRSRGDREI